MSGFASVKPYVTGSTFCGALRRASLSLFLLVGQACPTSSETLDSRSARSSSPWPEGLSLAFAKNSNVSHAGPAFLHVQASISVSPSVVETGTSPTLTLTSSGFFDLSEVRVPQVGIRPDEGVLDLKITSATAQRMALSFKLSEAASPGVRTLFIKDRNGVTVVALDLVLQRGAHICRPACEPPKRCRNNQCVLDPDICIPDCKPCERCRNNICVALRCDPPCREGANPPVICECGVCVELK